MMMIKPKRIQPNTGAIIPVNVLDTSKSSLDDLFHRFVDFIDAKTTVAKRNELHMFTVLPQRWIVERSWSGLDKCRRLWKKCERALNSSLQMVVLAFLKIVLKRY